ncbi:hypothetical protein JTB14_014788 [Gonioctena quinquepunctata]|nr:hypothetical protein JTB14_014788 [Gonioctena quinquepunctata]
MGLILSILVTCVGVCELIAFYYNVRRNLTLTPARGNLSTVTESYINELTGLKRGLVTDLQKLQNDLEISPYFPTLRLNSHEDVEIEYDRLLQRSRSPSPRRFLVTEKDVDRSSHSPPSPRRFLVSDDEPTIERSKSQSSVPEFSIKEGKNSEKSANKPRYVLQEKEGTSETPILPLPRQFIVTEEEINTLVFEDTDFEVPSRDKRSLFPIPQLKLPEVPRNSLSDVDHKSRSPSPSGKIDVILETTNFNTTQYWTNKVLVVPSRRSKSPSPGRQKEAVPLCESSTFLKAPKHGRVRSKSESNDHNVEVPVANGVKKAATNSNLTDEFECTFPFEWGEETPSFQSYSEYLDEVNKAKSNSKGTVMKKKKKNTKLENTISKVQEFFNNENTTAVLTNAAQEVSTGEKGLPSRPSETSGPKPGEPFWVKN